MKALKLIGGGCLLGIGILTSTVLHGQQLKLGSIPSVLEKSALLELNSDKQGLWLPRVSDYTVSPLNTAPDGMLIYYVPEKCLYIRKNSSWQKVLDGANGVTSVGLGNNKLLSTNATGIVTWIDKSTFLSNSLNSGRIWVGDAANTAQPVALTGDVSISNTGVTTIAANSITTTKILNSNVTLAKLADGGANQVLTTNAAGKPQWENKTGIVDGWALNGNTNATAANFLGTTNDIPFTIKTNNLEVIQFRTGVGAPGNVTALVNGALPFNSHPFTIRANGNDILAFEDAAGIPRWHWNLRGDGLNFVESNVEDYRLFLKNGGNVGVGTDNPVAKLDVNGDFKLGTTGNTFKRLYRTTVTISTANNIKTTTPVVTSVALTGLTANSVVTVNPTFDLAAGVAIAWARATTDQLNIGFINTTATNRSANGSYIVTVIEY